MCQTPLVNSLPAHIIDKVFNFLDGRSLVQACSVSKLFYSLARPRIFSSLYLQDYRAFSSQGASVPREFTLLRNDFNVLTNVDLELHVVNKARDTVKLNVYSYKRFVQYIESLKKLLSILKENDNGKLQPSVNDVGSSRILVKNLVVDFQLIDDKVNLAVFQLIFQIILTCRKLRSIEFKTSLIRDYFMLKIEKLFSKKKLVIDMALDKDEMGVLEPLDAVQGAKSCHDKGRTAFPLQNGGQTASAVDKIPNKNIQRLLKKNLVENNELMKISFHNYCLIFGEVSFNFKNNYTLFRSISPFDEHSVHFKSFVNDSLISDYYLRELVTNKWLINFPSKNGNPNFGKDDFCNDSVHTLNFELESSDNFINQLKGVYKIIQGLKTKARLLLKDSNNENIHLYNGIKTLNLSFQIHPARIITNLSASRAANLGNRHYDNMLADPFDDGYGEDYNLIEKDMSLQLSELVRCKDTYDFSNNLLSNFVNFASLKKLTVSKWSDHTISLFTTLEILKLNFKNSSAGFRNLVELNLINLPIDNDKANFLINFNRVFAFAGKFINLEFLQLNFYKIHDAEDFINMNIGRLCEGFKRLDLSLPNLQVFNFDCFNYWFLYMMLHSRRTITDEVKRTKSFAEKEGSEHDLVKSDFLYKCRCANCKTLLQSESRFRAAFKLFSSKIVILKICEFLSKLNNKSFRTNNGSNINNDLNTHPVPSIIMNDWLLKKDRFNDTVPISTTLEQESTGSSNKSSNESFDLDYSYVNMVITFFSHSFKNVVSKSLQMFPNVKFVVLDDLPIDISEVKDESPGHFNREDLVEGRQGTMYYYKPFIQLDKTYNFDDNLNEYDVVTEISKIDKYLDSELRAYKL